MAKYSYELKLRTVRDYLDGLGGFRAISKRYEVTARDVAKWVALYKFHGYEGLQKHYSSHTQKFKLRVLKAVSEKGLSFKSAAAQFNIPSPSTVSVWQRLYNEGGLDALKPKPKGPRPMRKKMDYQALLKKPIAELSHEELLQRLEYAEIENAYLKKLEALAQQKILASKNKPK
jgi:transposase